MNFFELFSSKEEMEIRLKATKNVNENFWDCYCDYLYFWYPEHGRSGDYVRECNMKTAENYCGDYKRVEEQIQQLKIEYNNKKEINKNIVLKYQDFLL